MSDDPRITHEEADGRGRYEAHVSDSDAIGLLTYQRRDDNTIVADHTLVPDALRGRGVASVLVKRLIADATAQGFTIVPRCSFVRAQFDRHPEWADLRAE